MVSYRDRIVLHGVNLTVGAGEVVSLLGANASGKTTTLRAVLGMARVQGGKVYFDGENIGRLPTQTIIRRGVAIVPENRRLFPRLTVEENLLVVLPGEAGRTGLRTVLESLRNWFPVLADRARWTQPAGTLSGGEQQQVAMARALLLRPRLLLLDEPSMGMAANLVEENFCIIKTLAQRGVGVLMVEQNVKMALSLASRGYVLQEGRIIHEGTAAELLASPIIQHSFLGEFI